MVLPETALVQYVVDVKRVVMRGKLNLCIADGQLIAADTVLPGSTLLAVARADHWDVAIPRDRDPNPLMRASTSGRGYPREALFRATIKWVVGAPP